MKYDIEYLNSDNFYIVKTTGNMTGDAFIFMAKELLKHPEYIPNNNVLFDHRNLNFKNTFVDDLEKIRNFHIKNKNRIGNGESVIVVKFLSEWNNLWKQGKKIQTGNIVQIFEDYNDAINWIKER
jgi:hypothetical protein